MRTRLRSKATLLFMMLGLLIAIPAVALADIIVSPDADIVTPGNQGSAAFPIDLGSVKGGGTLTKQVSFQLQCNGSNHVDNGQTVTVNFASHNLSSGSVTATNATIGPIPTSWPDDASGPSNCGTTPPTPIEDNGNSTVTVTAPTTAGTYNFSAIWQNNNMTPSQSDDSNDVSGSTEVFFKFTVDNTAPTVTTVAPAENATGVGIGTNVDATFSEAMDAITTDGDPSTIDGSTFTLTKPDGPDAGTDPDLVSGVVSYNSATNKATLNPDNDLDYSTTYTATVTTGAQDVAGNALDQNSGTAGNQPKTWTFTTEPPPNTAPVANAVTASTNEDNSTTITLSATDADGDDLTFEITDQPDNGQLGPIVPVNTTTATVNYTPNQNFNGPDSFKYRANDGTVNSAEVTGSITVIPVNDEPSFTSGGNVSVNEDSGAYSAAWATGISPGPANEGGPGGQTVSFHVSNDNNALFSSQPAISNSGTLTFTPEANAFGTATVSVYAQDSGGTANGGDDTTATRTFTITVTGVNDAPSFTAGSNQTVLEDAGAQTVDPWATGISAGPNEGSSQTVSFVVTSNSNTALFAAGGQPSVDSDGVLTYTPAANANGSATIKVKATDNGGTANNGVDQSAEQTFTITVDPVNDAPSFTKGPNQTVLEDAGAQTVDPWASAISKGPADEASQTVSFVVTNNTNTALFAAGGQPSVDSDGVLTYTPEANAFGSATVSVKITDNGGTANGGDDESDTQTFTITVTGVNDEPSFTKGADETVDEDAGAQTVNAWATAISAGPNETQTLTFDVTNDNNALFSTQPSVSSNGTLSYTPAADANGTATVSVTLKDNGGTANGGDDTSATQQFTITVNAVNDAPSFDLPTNPNQTVLVNAGAQSVSGFATNFDPGPANESGQALLKYVVTITNTNNTNLFSEPPAIDNTGKLTYKLAQDAIGTATVSVRAQDDGGTANNGVDLSAAKTFTIDVNYGFSGFLQPINYTAHQVLDTNVSTFKAGSTVPVKFYLTDANGNRVVQPVNAQWNTPQQGGKTNQAIDESVYTDPATSGSLYKWDSTAQQYIYNWSTKAPVAGGYFYKIGVTLPDGNTYYTYISLR